MSSFDDIKTLWQQQGQTPRPDAASVLQKARKDKQKIVRKSIIQGVCLLLTMIYICWFGTFSHFKKLTTYIGIALMLLCLLVYGVLRILQALRLRRIRLEDEPAVVLEKLRQDYKHRHLFNTRGIVIYTCILNIAFALYFIEVLTPLAMTMKIIFISLYLAWMYIALFVIGKRTIRKERTTMDAIMQQIQQLEKGLDTE